MNSQSQNTDNQNSNQAGQTFLQIIFGTGALFTVIIAVLLGHLVLGYWHIGQMLLKPHYQYVVLIPIVVWLLAMRGNPERVAKIPAQPGRAIPVTVGLVLSVGLAAFATWAWSPWVGGVSAVFSMLVVIYWYGGRRLVTEWFPAWVFCWTAIPIPFQRDEQLTSWMKSFSTEWASRFLDQFGILHLRYSNVLELPDKELFVADACSGIHSLFVLLAAGLLVALWNRRPLLHTIVLLGITFCLVLIENITRLVTVAVAWTRGIDITEGRPHQILGAVLFLVMLLFVLSADQMVRAILPSNHFFAEVAKLFRSRFLKRPAYVADPKKQEVEEAVSTRIPWPGMLLVCWVFPVMGVAQWTRIPDGVTNIAHALTATLEVPDLKEDVLPEEIHGYKRVSFKNVQRVEGDPLGKNSQIWEYKKGNAHFRISVDWPYEEVHDLCECYFNTGWAITSPRTIQQKETNHPYLEAELAKPLYGANYLLFSQCNSKGQFGYGYKSGERIGRSEDDTVEKQADNRLKSIFGTAKSGAAHIDGPFFQIHMIGRNPLQFNDSQKEELKQIYKEFRKLLVNQCLPEGQSLPEKKTKPSP